MFLNAKNDSRVISIIILLGIAIFNSYNLSANQKMSVFVPGEVMVKFKHDTEQDGLLSKALESDTPDLAVLKPVADSLSSTTKIPLVVKQVLSGRWVLLKLNPNTLIIQSLPRLKQIESIADVSLKTSTDKSLYDIKAQQFDIVFNSESREFDVVKAKREERGESDFKALIETLAIVLDYPVQAYVDQRNHLILKLDQREISFLMKKRLSELTPVIESTQLNYISSPM